MIFGSYLALGVDRITANAAESLSSAHLLRLLRVHSACAECECWDCRVWSRVCWVWMLRVPSVDAESADYSALNIQHLLSVNVESLSSNKKIWIFSSMPRVSAHWDNRHTGVPMGFRWVLNGLPREYIEGPPQIFSKANTRLFPRTDPRTKPWGASRHKDFWTRVLPRVSQREIPRRAFNILPRVSNWHCPLRTQGLL